MKDYPETSYRNILGHFSLLLIKSSCNPYINTFLGIKSNDVSPSFWFILEHISHSHAKKGRKHHSAGRGDKGTIADEKYEGSTQICGITETEQEALANIQRAKELSLCGETIVKKGCYKNVAKEFGGKMLIDRSYSSTDVGNYSQNMYE